MVKHRLPWRALLLMLFFAVFLTETALAETRTVSNVTGSTWHDTNSSSYKSRTTSSSPAPWIYVNFRNWGSPPNPLKDERIASKKDSTTSGTVSIPDLYNGPYPSQHLVNTAYGGVEIYTSDNACFSNYCWWYYGITSPQCPSTC